MVKGKYNFDGSDIEVTVKFVEPPSKEDANQREDRIISILTQSAINIVRKGLNK